MSRVLLMVFLTLMSNSLMAEWYTVRQVNKGIIYVDPTTISNNAHMVKMLGLMDYDEQQTLDGTPYYSEAPQWEFDCKGRKFRLIAMNFYSSSMGGGTSVSSINSSGKWEAVGQEETIKRRLFNIACWKNLAGIEKINQSQLTVLHIDDLKVDFHSMQGRKVRFASTGLYAMDIFLLVKDLSDTSPLVINTSKVPKDQRRRILEDCSDIRYGCDVVVYGTVEKISNKFGIAAEKVEWLSDQN